MQPAPGDPALRISEVQFSIEGNRDWLVQINKFKANTLAGLFALPLTQISYSEEQSNATTQPSASLKPKECIPRGSVQVQQAQRLHEASSALSAFNCTSLFLLPKKQHQQDS